MAVTIKQTEAIPASYPAVGGLSNDALLLDPAAIWQRIESYIAHRWTPRNVEWIVEGAGDWTPPLCPATLTLAEVWEMGEWSETTLAAGPYGYCFAGDGPYRITATVGAGDMPEAVNEAFRRLAEYLAAESVAPAGATSYTLNLGQISESVELRQAHVARALQYSGAADLLRHTGGCDMGFMDLFRRSTNPEETRASGTGYTAEIMAARESYIAGRTGLGDLTATVQACVSLWEGGFALADVSGTDLLDRRSMALLGRSAALRGEAVLLIRDDRLIPCADWDLSTRDGIPRAYRVSISEAGGGRSETALAAEVIHLRVAADPVAPWTGTPPLRRARLTAGLLHTLETALGEIYENAPIASQVLPFPEAPDTDMEALGRGFRGKRGRVLLRESVNVAAAGGPAPAQDWKSNDVTPDIQRSQALQSTEAARAAILAAFGVLPGLFASQAQGPLVREAQRHLAQWTLQPIAALLAEEASEKLATKVEIDTLRALQAFDAGGRARAAAGIVQAMAMAKEAGVDASEAMKLVNWQD